MTTCQFRKCRDCNYFQPTTNKSVMGWCYWKGRYKKKNEEECEDGFVERQKR